MSKQLLHLSKVVALCQDGKPHRFVFVAKGNNKTKGGYLVEMNNTIVTSSSFEHRKFNLKCLDSFEIRWCYYVLLIEYDNFEVII